MEVSTISQADTQADTGRAATVSLAVRGGASTVSTAARERVATASLAVRGCAAALLISVQVAFGQSGWDGAGAAEQAARTEALLQQIRTEETRAGIHSPELIELMTALGLAHQEHGDHALAAAAFERARQVVRVNYGFSTVEEMQLLSHLVTSAYASGDVVTAWSLEEQLLTHASQHARSLDAVPVFRSVAQRRARLYEQYRSGEIPPQIHLGCYYAGAVRVDAVTMMRSLTPAQPRSETGCRSGSRHTALVTLLNEYRSYQALAIAALVANDRVTGELQALVSDLLQSSYELYALVPKFRDVHVNRLFRRLLEVEPEDRPADILRAEMLVQLADYNLYRVHQSGRMTHFDRVLEQYGQAYRQMKQAGVDEATLKRYFFPDTPVRVPIDERKAMPPDAAGQGAHVELAFDLTRYGLSRRVKVVNSTEGVPRSASRALAREIRQAGFRPRLSDGRHPESASFVVRFAVAD